MTENKLKMIEHLNTLGVRKGDCLLVHSSFSKLAQFVTPVEAIEALECAVGENGTLVLPALSWKNVNASNPSFNVDTTPVCVGFLPELFRTSKGVKRSMHPTHSCSVYGKKQDEFINSHYLDDTPVGENSPFRKLAENNGKILFLGCLSASNTSMHGVEELVTPPYLFGKDMTYSMTSYDRKTYNKLYHTHGFANTIQRYERAEMLMNQYELSKGNVLESACTLMSASALWRKGKETLEENKLFFVDITK